MTKQEQEFDHSLLKNAGRRCDLIKNRTIGFSQASNILESSSQSETSSRLSYNLCQACHQQKLQRNQRLSQTAPHFIFPALLRGNTVSKRR